MNFALLANAKSVSKKPMLDNTRVIRVATADILPQGFSGVIMLFT